MAKMTIIEGNSNDKDNVRAYMVKGEAGVSPTVQTSKEWKTATITITDYTGPHTFTLDDGFSPVITTSKENKVTTVTITDAEGTHTATINDGEDGVDGVSPTVQTSKENGVTTISITDYEGTHTATINDGEVTNEQLTRTLANYKLNGDFAVITGSILVTKSSDPGNLYTQILSNIEYPSGFNKDNCVCVSFGVARDVDNKGYSYEGSESIAFTSGSMMLGNIPRRVTFKPNNIQIALYSISGNDMTIYYQIVLMKI